MRPTNPVPDVIRGAMDLDRAVPSVARSVTSRHRGRRPLFVRQGRPHGSGQLQPLALCVGAHRRGLRPGFRRVPDGPAESDWWWP